VDSGAKLAESPADAARQANVIITMVTGPPALQAVMDGPNGIVAGVRGTSTVIQMSTVAGWFGDVPTRRFDVHPRGAPGGQGPPDWGAGPRPNLSTTVNDARIAGESPMPMSQ